MPLLRYVTTRLFLMMIVIGSIWPCAPADPFSGNDYVQSFDRMSVAESNPMFRKAISSELLF